MTGDGLDGELNGDLDEGLHGVAVYNPNLLSRDELKRGFVARMQLLERVLRDLRRERRGCIGQHRILLGPHGMGKTSLLRRISIAVEEDEELGAIWLPLTFPEEQSNIEDLADLWLNCLNAIGDALERCGTAAEAGAVQARIQSLREDAPDDLLSALLDLARQLDRRLLLLLDNVDLILERLRDDHWALRETLQSSPELLLIGTSARPIEASYQYDSAFYDFFRIDELKGLTEQELRATLLRLAEIGRTPAVAELVERDPSRIRTLHLLNVGNPRSAALLYGVLLTGSAGDVRSDLEGLLDRLTPHYQAGFEALPARGQQLVHALALHWDPASARQLANRLGWEVNLVSAQLDRLQRQGVVEKTETFKGKRALFQIADRGLNMWYLMRAGPRTRRRLSWLVRFLYILLRAEETDARAAQELGRQVGDASMIEFGLTSTQGIKAAQRLQDILEVGGAALTEKTLASLLPLLQEAVRAGQAAAARDLLDKTEAGQQWWPLREGLAAAVEGSADYLRLVAPEVRKPAQIIFERLVR